MWYLCVQCSWNSTVLVTGNTSAATLVIVTADDCNVQHQFTHKTIYRNNAYAYCALLTNIGNGAHNTFLYLCSSAGNFKHDHMCPWSTKAVISNRYICINRQQYIVWLKIINFSFMPKIVRILRSCSMKIFSKFPTVNISKLNF